MIPARQHGTRTRSILATLRDLTPRRPLTGLEQQRIAELQANRLLALSGVTGPATPEGVITDLPRLRVETVIGLSVSGLTTWVGSRWLITLAEHEVPTRQRFSLAHEFKHILDHPWRDRLYPDRQHLSSAQQAERVADHFAACLLMPKRWVVRAWTSGTQHLEDLARLFDVSPQAMHIRLQRLGLIEPASRCLRRSLPVRTRTRIKEGRP